MPFVHCAQMPLYLFHDLLIAEYFGRGRCVLQEATLRSATAVRTEQRMFGALAKYDGARGADNVVSGELDLSKALIQLALASANLSAR
mmetsp:Transcript_19566/g.50536  ORF Transcript_19566/g.50536 Transcript_19566/m.50536 type:complete len:88 (-) Transcript_19566:248-511(-)